MIRVSTASLALLLSVALAGCTPPAPTPSASTASATPSPTTTPTPTPTPTHTTDDPCLRDSLDITYTATDNSAGHAHGIITLTNISTATCNIEGYPTVWFDNPEAQQAMGAAATKEPFDGTVPSFDLVPGASAVSNLTITEAGFVDGCTMVDSIALLVVPPLPGEVSDPSQFWRHVPIDATPACSNDDATLLSVSAAIPQ